MAGCKLPILPTFYSFLEKLENSWQADTDVESITSAIRKNDLESLQAVWKDEKKLFRHEVTGLNFLQMAVMKGHVEVVQFMIDRGMDIDDTACTMNTCTYSGLSCCHIAVAFRHREMLTYLKSLECSVDGQLHIHSDGEEFKILNGMSPLHFSVLLNDLGSFNLLLDCIAPLNAQSISGLTPLHLAAMLNYDTIAQILLKKKVLKNVCSKDGATPLFLAARHGAQNVLKLLMDHGYRLDATLPSGCTVVHAAAEHGAVDAIVLLSRAGCGVDNQTGLVHLDGKGLFGDATPLHLAAISGKRYCVEALLKEGADPNLCCTIENLEGETKNVTALHLAVMSNSELMCRLLVEHGADLNAENSEKETPFLISVQRNNAKIQNFFLKYEKIEVNIKNGQALLTAVDDNLLELVEQILKHPRAVMDNTHKWAIGGKVYPGLTPLHIAVSKGYIDIVKKFLECGADVTSKAVHKVGEVPSITLMHLLAWSNDPSTALAKILLNAGCPFDHPTLDGITPLMLAVDDCNFSLINFLLDQGADINKQDNDQLTCLIRVVKTQPFVGLDVVKLLIKRGADVDIQDKRGFCALHCALYNKDIEMANILLESRCNVNLKTTEPLGSISWDNVTPLVLAIQFLDGQDLDNIVDKLLEKGANPMARFETKQDLTPLHAAAKYDRVNIIKTLLRKGSDLNAINKVGRSALWMALDNENNRSAELLIRKGANLEANFETMEWLGIPAFHKGLESCDSNVIQFLVDFGADIFSHCFDSKLREQTPFFVALLQNPHNMVHKLIDIGVDVNECSEGVPPLHNLLEFGDEAVVQDTKSLLLYGADANATMDEFDSDADSDDSNLDETNNRKNVSALQTAAEMSHTDCARLLLQAGAMVDATSEDSTRTNIFPIFHAIAEYGEVPLDLVQLLLNMGTDLDAYDSNCMDAVHFACYAGSGEILDYLVKCGAGVNQNATIEMCEDVTPLHNLLMDNYYDGDIVEPGRVLIRAGAGVNAQAYVQSTRISPLVLSVAEEQEDMTRLLLRHGAHVNFMPILGGNSALLQAIVNENHYMFQILMDTNVDVNLPNRKNGISPVIKATMLNQVEMVRALIGAGCDVNKMCTAFDEDDDDFDDDDVNEVHCTEATALHQAAELGYLKIAKLLIEAGAFLSAKENHQGKPGYTPLHCAAVKGHQDLVKVLVEAKCDINAQTEEGMTALHLCVKEGDSSMASLLNSLGINPMLKNEVNQTASALSTLPHLSQQLLNFELAWTYSHKEPKQLQKRLSLHQRMSLHNLGLSSLITNDNSTPQEGEQNVGRNEGENADEAGQSDSDEDGDADD